MLLYAISQIIRLCAEISPLRFASVEMTSPKIFSYYVISSNVENLIVNCF